MRSSIFILELAVSSNIRARGVEAGAVRLDSFAYHPAPEGVNKRYELYLGLLLRGFVITEDSYENHLFQAHTPMFAFLCPLMIFEVSIVLLFRWPIVHAQKRISLLHGSRWHGRLLRYYMAAKNSPISAE